MLLIGGLHLLQVAPAAVIVKLALACMAAVPQALPTGSSGESLALWFEDREARPRNTERHRPLLSSAAAPAAAAAAAPPQLPGPNFRERHGEIGPGGGEGVEG